MSITAAASRGLIRGANRYKVRAMAVARTGGVVASLALGATLLVLPGCDSRITQCNELIGVINAEQEPIKRASGDDPESLMKLATALDQVGVHVGDVALKDASLVTFRDNYAAMAKELATAARDTAAAIEAKDAEKATKAANHMTSFGTRESELVGEINGYCSGKP